MQKTGQQKKRKSAEVQAAIRQQVTEYLKKNTGSQQQAAGIFGLSLNGVHKIWKRYKEGGKRNIAQRKRGVTGGKKINGVQSAEIRRLIKDKLPDQLKLPFG